MIDPDILEKMERQARQVEETSPLPQVTAQATVFGQTVKTPAWIQPGAMAKTREGKPVWLHPDGTWRPESYNASRPRGG